MEHEHTGVCADMSQYVLVQVRVVIKPSGSADVRVAMKPGGSCWSDVDEVATARRLSVGSMPRSPEAAAHAAIDALRAAFPTIGE